MKNVLSKSDFRLDLGLVMIDLFSKLFSPLFKVTLSVYLDLTYYIRIILFHLARVSKQCLLDGARELVDGARELGTMTAPIWDFINNSVIILI